MAVKFYAGIGRNGPFGPLTVAAIGPWNARFLELKMTNPSAPVSIEALMDESGVKFGTSGARGLVSAMTDRVCAAYTLGFLLHLRAQGLSPSTKVVIGGDLRPSTPRIARAVAFAAEHLGHPVEFAGWIPSPAVALRGLSLGAPSIMVTGSHIPDDRNGIKFNSPTGEATKADEEGVRAKSVVLPDAFDASGMLRAQFAVDLGEARGEAREAYLDRYLRAFPSGCLNGVSLGVYGHSAVGRDLLVELYEKLGAEVFRLGFSERFVPVDTEAIRDEDVEKAATWAKERPLAAIVSTDGDSDRPLISDERGQWIRGDVAGVLVAKYLGVEAVATPVSCNTLVDLVGFQEVIRTKIGSPFVIAGMEAARRLGIAKVAGYEANGGFLTLTDLDVPLGNVLPALPTRDAVVVHLAILLAAKNAGVSLSEVVGRLPARYTASDRDVSFAQARSVSLLEKLRALSAVERREAFSLGDVKTIDETDGMRITFTSDEVVHLRPSGNAPELRCYAESSSPERAAELVRHGLSVARRLA
jgi:phosphomannomutase